MGGKKLTFEKVEFFTSYKSTKALKILEILQYQVTQNYPMA